MALKIKFVASIGFNLILHISLPSFGISNSIDTENFNEILNSVDQILNDLSQDHSDEASDSDLTETIEKSAINEFLSQFIADLNSDEFNLLLVKLSEIYLNFPDKRSLVRKLVQSTFDKAFVSSENEKTSQVFSVIDDTFFYGFILLFGRRIAHFLLLHFSPEMKSRILKVKANIFKSYKKVEVQVPKLRANMSILDKSSSKNEIIGSFGLGFALGLGHFLFKKFELKKVDPIVFLELVDYKLACDYSVKSINFKKSSGKNQQWTESDLTEKRLLEKEIRELLLLNPNLKYEKYDSLIDFVTHSDEKAIILYNKISTPQLNLCKEISLDRLLNQMREIQ